MRRLLLLTGQHRTQRLNIVLGCLLAFNAGAVNAGGFLVLHMYTSHMTGFLAMLVDSMVLGQVTLMLAALAALLFFTAGAATTALLIHAARRHEMRSEYALPLAIEATLMLAFGLLGGLLVNRQTPFALPLIVPLLAYIMGLQNALMSKVSSSQIRTTHMTGVITDLGMELGKMLYWNRSVVPGLYVSANRSRLLLLGSLLGMFVLGGLYGATGFKHVGFICVVPLALILLLLSLPVLISDWRRYGLRQLLEMLWTRRPGAEGPALTASPGAVSATPAAAHEVQAKDANPPRS